MKLWVLRHGEAESHAPSDAQRNLTERGRQEALHSAAHLIGADIKAIIASPSRCTPPAWRSWKGTFRWRG